MVELEAVGMHGAGDALTLMVELEAVGMHGAVEELGVGVVLELAEDGGVLQQQHEHADHVRVARLVVRRQLLVT